MAIKICNVSPEAYKIQRSYNFNALFIPACLDGATYTSLVIEDHTDVRVIHTEFDAAKAERIPVVIPAEVIVRDFFGAEQLALKGCFTCKVEEPPTEKQLADAKAARVAFLQKCVQDGDVEYARSGRVDEIPGAWKRYAEELGVEREWAFIAPKAMFDCPACGERLKVGVAICRSCGAVLDKAKAEKFGLAQPKPVPVRA